MRAETCGGGGGGRRCITRCTRCTGDARGWTRRCGRGRWTARCTGCTRAASCTATSAVAGRAAGRAAATCTATACLCTSSPRGTCRGARSLDARWECACSAASGRRGPPTSTRLWLAGVLTRGWAQEAAQRMSLDDVVAGTGGSARRCNAGRRRVAGARGRCVHHAALAEWSGAVDARIAVTTGLHNTASSTADEVCAAMSRAHTAPVSWSTPHTCSVQWQRRLLSHHVDAMWLLVALVVQEQPVRGSKDAPRALPCGGRQVDG